MQRKNDWNNFGRGSSRNRREWSHLNQNFDRPVHEIKQSSNIEENQEKILIKKLQDRNKILEEQVIQFQARIKILEDQLKKLHRDSSPTSKISVVDNPTNDVQHGNAKDQKQVEEETLRKKTGISTNYSIGTGNRMFNRWMNSREPNKSLWSNEGFCNSLLYYIGGIYGQKSHIFRILEPLRIQFNKSDELDQLYRIIKHLEKQPGSNESLSAWRGKRSSHRSDEFKIMFEYDTISSSILNQWKIDVASDVIKIVDIPKITGYFDLMCRDGEITVEVGQYLNLSKENIFGGNVYDSENDKITFAKINLTQSTIDLADNCVDLITCFVTLHHVPDLKQMLRELIRILKPGGYLILREHDCKKEYSLKMKYLNFVHAFMIIVRIDEFAHLSVNPSRQKLNESTDWEQLKAEIINNTSSIQYHSRNEWNSMLENIGFQWKATLDYAASRNPQALYYSVFQLHSK